MKARDNPFRVERLHQLRFRPRDVLEQVIAQLENSNYRGAIVGPHGTGKSTLLEEMNGLLRLREKDSSLLRLTAETHSRGAELVADWLRRTPSQAVLLFDGAEQLSSGEWNAFLAASQPFAGLVITTHRPGRLPTLCQTSSSPALLDDLVRELVPLRTGEDEQLLARLYSRHRGNVRDCLRELYDRWGERVEH